MKQSLLFNVGMFAGVALAAGGVPVRSRKNLAPKSPPKPPPPSVGWEGDGVLPERETRQQRRARERKGGEQPPARDRAKIPFRIEEFDRKTLSTVMEEGERKP